MVTIGPTPWRRSGLAAVTPSGQVFEERGSDERLREVHVTVIAEFGIFMAGLGIFFLGCGLLWWVSLQKQRD
jgi:hypothetical protein